MQLSRVAFFIAVTISVVLMFSLSSRLIRFDFFGIENDNLGFRKLYNKVLDQVSLNSLTISKREPGNYLKLVLSDNSKPDTALNFDQDVRSVWNFGREQGSRSKQRTLCTTVRDMTPYLKEWIDFHVLVGWTKFYIYDHLSKDNLREFLEINYPADVVEYVNITWKMRYGGNQGMTKIQYDCMKHCFEHVWTSSEVIATIDVDEFIYPAEQHWKERDCLGHAFKQMGFFNNKSLTTLTNMHCLHYGFGDYNNTPTTPILVSYARRAPLKGEKTDFVDSEEYVDFCSKCDNTDKHWCYPQVNRTIPYCRKCRFCIHLEPFNKILYFPNGRPQVNVRPSVHRAHFLDKNHASVPYAQIERKTGILCNHYRFRSFFDVANKTYRNKASQSFLELPQNHPYYRTLSSVTDRKILDFIMARRLVLQQDTIDFFGKYLFSNLM